MSVQVTSSSPPQQIPSRSNLSRLEHFSFSWLVQYSIAAPFCIRTWTWEDHSFPRVILEVCCLSFPPYQAPSYPQWTVISPILHLNVCHCLLLWKSDLSMPGPSLVSFLYCAATFLHDHCPELEGAASTGCLQISRTAGRMGMKGEGFFS